MDACIKGEVRVVQTLLNQNASVNIADSDGYTPLHLAANHGNYEVVKMLVSSAQNPDVNARAKDQSTSIMKPAEKGFSMIVKYLLENNADPNIADQVNYFTHVTVWE